MDEGGSQSAPVCPRCLGVEPGVPAEVRSHGPLAEDLCGPCERVVKEHRAESTPRRIAVFDLPSVFWPVAEARARDEQPAPGTALAVARHLRELVDRYRCDGAVFACERKPYWREDLLPAGAYKRGRKQKDPALVAELELLADELTAAGFFAQAVASGHRDEVLHWFEADDVAASFAVRIVAAGDHAVVVSNDWDLAQVLPDEDSEDSCPVPPRAFLARANGVDRWVSAADVRRHFGVPPSRVWDYLALAGDGDFQPYPGTDPGGGRRASPGVGESTAKKLLAKFGSFHACLAAALADEATARAAFEGLPARALDLLRAGGEEQASRARRLAQLRIDVPLPDAAAVALRGADLTAAWGRAEEALRARLRDDSAPGAGTARPLPPPES